MSAWWLCYSPASSALGAVVSDAAAGVTLMGACEVQSDVRVMDWLCSSMDGVLRMGASMSAGVSCSGGLTEMYLELECNWNGLEWHVPGTGMASNGLE